MAIPLIAAGIAARAVAKKLATRAVGGITGAGAKQVTPVYRNSPVSARMGDLKGVKTNQSGSLKVISNKNTQTPLNSMGDKRPQASLPINSLARGKNAIRVNSNPMRGK